MAKRNPIGSVGRKLAKPPAAIDTGLRETTHESRRVAFDGVVNSLQPFTKPERTQLLAAVAEFFGLSLTVEN